MSLNPLIFFSFYFLILTSTIGYGYLIVNITKLQKDNLSFAYLGLFGIFFLIFYSYLSHYFIAHNYLNNSIILILGIFVFIINFFYENKKKDIVFLYLFFLILFIGVLIFKSHDDFFYYHFPYTYYLTQSNILIGTGNFNHGFRTPSSIFYLNSLFYLPFIKYYFFQIGATLIMGFTSLVFLKSIIKNLNDNKLDNIFFLSLLCFCFINIFFYRISEHGTDRSAQILILLFITELIVLINYYNFTKENIAKIIVLLGLIISLKSYYILYLVLTLVVFYYVIKDKKYIYIFEIFKNPFLYIFIFQLILLLITNFFNSGCLIYPVSATCFENFSWSIPLKEVVQMNNWYEQWSKAGAGPNFRVDNPEIFIQNFNWVNDWIEKYFFTKVSDLILGLSFLILIFLIVFKSKSNKDVKSSNKSNLILLVLFLLLAEWFYNHPALRYGGYPLIALLIFIPVSNFLGNKKFINNNINNKVFSIIIICLSLFFLRNVDRILDENKKYDYLPTKKINYQIDDRYFIIQNEFENIISKNKDCIKKNKICKNHDNSNIKKEMGYLIFFKDK